MGSAVETSFARGFSINSYGSSPSSPNASFHPPRHCSRKMSSVTLAESFQRFRKLSRTTSTLDLAAASKSRAQSIDADAHLSGNVYLEAIPSDVEPARKLLESYSGVRRKEYDDHVHRMRDKLWHLYPFTCVGHFRFLSLHISDQRYEAARSRLLDRKSFTRFLDIGCCVGQTLRQLAAEGVDSEKLYGIDIEPGFFEMGYELFRDRNKMKATFLRGDVLADSSDNDDDSDDTAYDALGSLDGSMNIIHASRFFHLFNWDMQLRAAKRMIRFLRSDDPHVMIFGSQVGTIAPGDKSQRGRTRFLHDATTWQHLWDEAGRQTGTAWRTEMDILHTPGTKSPNTMIKGMRFGVYRA